jgi:hypothetical protein
MQKPTFKNFHKQKYTLLRKNMQRKNTVDSNPITLKNLGKYQVLLPYTHLEDVEEIFNPLDVSLGASES